jgi:hypothetical protein
MLLRDTIHAANTCAVKVSLAPELVEVCVVCELWGIEHEQGALVVLEGRGTNDPLFEKVGLRFHTSRSK